MKLKQNHEKAHKICSVNIGDASINIKANDRKENV